MAEPKVNPVQAERKDPKSRPVHASTLGGQIRNPDPNKYYVWASKEGTVENANNYEYYSSIGFELERWDEKNKLQIHRSGITKSGEPIYFRDMVLMSCSNERKEEIDEFGPDGGTGRNLFRNYMKKIEQNQIEKPNDRIEGLIHRHDISVEDGIFR